MKMGLKELGVFWVPLQGFRDGTWRQPKIEDWTTMKQTERRGSGRVHQKGWTKMGQNAAWGLGV